MPLSLEDLAIICFNSIKVQLKVAQEVKTVAPWAGFNSIKVQLKVSQFSEHVRGCVVSIPLRYN